MPAVRLNQLFQPLGALTERAAASLQGRHSRRTWVGNGRAHIEVRGLSGPRSEEVAASLKTKLERLRGVHWAEVNVALGRAIVAIDSDEPDVGDLIEAIEQDRQPLGSVYDGRAALEMILAVYESHRLQGVVELPLKNRKHPLSML